MSRAAEKLYVTQPALSKMISRLEQSLGCALFVRRGRQLILNMRGEIFYKWTCDTLDSYEKMRGELNDYLEQRMTTLTVGISGTHFSGPIIYGFMEENPGCHINEVFFGKSEFPGVLYRNEIDCILSSRDICVQGIESYRIYTEPLCLVVHRKHPLAQKKGIYLSEIADEPLLFTSKDHMFRDTLKEAFEQAGVELRLKAGFDRDHLWGAVKKGLGIVIVAQQAAETAGGELCAIPLLDSFAERSIYLQWRKREEYPWYFEHFIRYVQNYKVRRE